MIRYIKNKLGITKLEEEVKELKQQLEPPPEFFFTTSCESSFAASCAPDWNFARYKRALK